MCDWTNELTFKFLELYQNEPVIWNPKLNHHKDKKKINDAWSRISRELECSITELKKKKDSLMATFRGHLRKKKLLLNQVLEQMIFTNLYGLLMSIWSLF